MQMTNAADTLIVVAQVGEDSGKSLERDHVLAIQLERRVELAPRFVQAPVREIGATEDDAVPNAAPRPRAALFTELDRLVEAPALHQTLGQL
jgi:hypothetical protein